MRTRIREIVRAVDTKNGTHSVLSVT